MCIFFIIIILVLVVFESPSCSSDATAFQLIPQLVYRSNSNSNRNSSSDSDSNTIKHLDRAALEVLVGLWGDNNGYTYLSEPYNNRVVRVSTGSRVVTRDNRSSVDSTVLIIGGQTPVHSGSSSGSSIRSSSSGKFCGDGGPAVSGCVWQPSGLWGDGHKYLYIADSGNNRIRRVDIAACSADVGESNDPNDPSYSIDPNSRQVELAENSFCIGTVETIAGTGAAAFNGDNIPATAAALDGPQGIWGDSTGSYLYVADTLNHRLRRIHLVSGMISTVLGSYKDSRKFTSSFESNAVSGRSLFSSFYTLRSPRSLWVDNENNVYFTEQGQALVRNLNGEFTVIRTAIASSESVNRFGTKNIFISGAEHTINGQTERLLIYGGSSAVKVVVKGVVVGSIAHLDRLDNEDDPKELQCVGVWGSLRHPMVVALRYLDTDKSVVYELHQMVHNNPEQDLTSENMNVIEKPEISVTSIDDGTISDARNVVSENVSLQDNEDNHSSSVRGSGEETVESESCIPINVQSNMNLEQSEELSLIVDVVEAGQLTSSASKQHVWKLLLWIIVITLFIIPTIGLTMSITMRKLTEPPNIKSVPQQMESNYHNDDTFVFDSNEVSVGEEYHRSVHDVSDGNNRPKIVRRVSTRTFDKQLVEFYFSKAHPADEKAIDDCDIDEDDRELSRSPSLCTTVSSIQLDDLDTVDAASRNRMAITPDMSPIVYDTPVTDGSIECVSRNDYNEVTAGVVNGNLNNVFQAINNHKDITHSESSPFAPSVRCNLFSQIKKRPSDRERNVSIGFEYEQPTKDQHHEQTADKLKVPKESAKKPSQKSNSPTGQLDTISDTVKSSNQVRTVERVHIAPVVDNEGTIKSSSTLNESALEGSEIMKASITSTAKHTLASSSVEFEGGSGKYTSEIPYADLTLNLLREQLRKEGKVPIEFIPLADIRAELSSLFAAAHAGESYDEGRLDFLLMCMEHNPEYQQEKQVEHNQWRQEIDDYAKECLEEMRGFVPPFIFHTSLNSLVQDHKIGKELARRIMAKKCLWLVRVSSNDIDKMHIAELSGRFNTEANGLDIVETAAVYASLPEAFSNDGSGKKTAWKLNLENNLKQMVLEKKRGLLPKTKQRNGAYSKQDRPFAELEGLHEFTGVKRVCTDEEEN